MAEQAQEGLSPEEIRLEVLRKIQQLCLDEEIYREFQLYLDEREVERSHILNQSPGCGLGLIIFEIFFL